MAITSPTPGKPTKSPDLKVVAVAAGAAYSLVVTSTGKLYSFGDNVYGELGRSTSNTSDYLPRPVTLPGATGAVTQVAVR